MTRNAGILDSTLRIGAGMVLLVLALVPALSPWLGLLGVVLVMTGAYGFCPLYRLIGLSTESRT